MGNIVSATCCALHFCAPCVLAYVGDSSCMWGYINVLTCLLLAVWVIESVCVCLRKCVRRNCVRLICLHFQSSSFVTILRGVTGHCATKAILVKRCLLFPHLYVCTNACNCAWMGFYVCLLQGFTVSTESGYYFLTLFPIFCAKIKNIKVIVSDPDIRKKQLKISLFCDGGIADSW